jgi:hypothetical protein
MTAVELLVRLAVGKTNLPDQSRSAQLESGVRRKAHAPFGAGERLRNPTYRHPGRNPGSEEDTSWRSRSHQSQRPAPGST